MSETNRYQNGKIYKIVSVLFEIPSLRRESLVELLFTRKNDKTKPNRKSNELKYSNRKKRKEIPTNNQNKQRTEI